MEGTVLIEILQRIPRNLGMVAMKIGARVDEERFLNPLSRHYGKVRNRDVASPMQKAHVLMRDLSLCGHGSESWTVGTTLDSFGLILVFLHVDSLKNAYFRGNATL